MKALLLIHCFLIGLLVAVGSAEFVRLPVDVVRDGTSAQQAHKRAAHLFGTKNIDIPVTTTSTEFAYYASVSFGANAEQTFHLQVDTGSSVLFVSGEYCYGCPALPNGGYSPTPSYTAGPSQYNDVILQYGSGSAQGSLGIENVTIGRANGVSIGRQYFVTVDTMFFSFSVPGILGIAGPRVTPWFGQQNYKTVVQNVFSKFAPENYEFSLFITALNGGSELILGGTDPSLMQPGTDFTSTPLLQYNGPDDFPWYLFAAQSVTINGTEIEYSANLQGIADSGTSLIAVPQAMYCPIGDALAKDTAQMIHRNTSLTLYYRCPDGSCSTCFNDFVINLPSGAALAIKPTELLAKMDNHPDFGNICAGLFSPLPSTVSEVQAIWGDPFFRAQYISFDVGSGNLRFAPNRDAGGSQLSLAPSMVGQVPYGSRTAMCNAYASTPSNGDDGLSTTAVALVIVAVIAALVAGVMIYSKRNQRAPVVVTRAYVPSAPTAPVVYSQGIGYQQFDM